MSNFIGIRVGRATAFDWSTYLASLNPALWIKPNTRSGLTLPDSVNPGANDASLLMPYISTDATGYLKYTDSSSYLDILTSDFTMCTWARAGTTSKAAITYIVGKNSTALYVSGLYGIFADITTGFICARIITTSGTGGYTITSAVDFSDQNWYFIRMTVDHTADKMHLYINEVEVGTGISFAGNFNAAPTNVFSFSTRDGVTGSKAVDYSDTYVFHKLLTPTECATLYARGSVTGSQAHWCMTELNYNDVSGNNLHLTGSHAQPNAYITKKYGANGSRQGLEKGYSIYKLNLSADIYIPYDDTGIALITPSVPAGYAKDSDVAGINNDHNYADSIILFAGDEWDRSVTTVYNNLARITQANSAGEYGYDATWVKGHHVIDLYQLKMMNAKLDAYKGTCFVNRTSGLELFTYATNKTGSDLTKILTYLGVNTTIESHYATYSLHTRHIWHVNGLKVLESDIASGTIYLSLDGGVTFPKTYVNAAQLSAGICFAHIFNNGNIWIAGQQKVYWSTDNLDTVNEFTPLEYDDTNYSPTATENFKPIGLDREIDGRPFVWGNYPVTAGGRKNLWYINIARTELKQVHEFGVGPGDTWTIDHVHTCIYDSVHDEYLITTGDTTPLWLKATYDIDTDVWTLSEIMNPSHVLTSGLCFYDGYYWWAGDAAAPNNSTFKCLYDDIADATKYIRVFIGGSALPDENGEFLGVVPDSVASKYSQILSSIDGVNFRSIDCLVTGTMTPATYHGLIAQNPKFSDDNKIIEIYHDGETIRNYQNGEVVVAKINI